MTLTPPRHPDNRSSPDYDVCDGGPRPGKGFGGENEHGAAGGRVSPVHDDHDDADGVEYHLHLPPTPGFFQPPEVLYADDTLLVSEQAALHCVDSSNGVSYGSP